MRINIIKILLFLLVLFSSQNAAAFEWVLVSEKQERKHYIDNQSLREDSGFRWAYYKSEYPKVQSASDYNTKKNYSFISAVTYMAFNCRDKTLVPLSTNYLNSAGKIQHKIRYASEKNIIEGDKTWELDDNPETFRAEVISYVCDQKL